MSLINMKLSKDNNIFYNLENIEALVNEKVIEFEIENTKNVYNISDKGCIFKRENDEFEFVLLVLGHHVDELGSALKPSL